MSGLSCAGLPYQSDPTLLRVMGESPGGSDGGALSVWGQSPSAVLSSAHREAGQGARSQIRQPSRRG
ncbi:hypothetical protein BDP55DRAFT_667261 [Colletotrichum godetiae]|uniref:Uncharacterized protein n=1 Tax=Colletotrichum godetiae TaxID=1209918 RepID=A0AAJ0ERT7_9PEZI|nr:uncharacterized protein BDP55DRAFT_667261 [Colletotrichum godetiae]KAK1674316.1 hypothetical protein BDP55DRAFT_667261 [Colletotrichum godetiae]